MFETILDIIQGLLPTKDLPNKVWIPRLIALCGVIFLCFQAITHVLQDTDLGKNMGVDKTNLEIPRLNHTEVIYAGREAWLELRRLRDTNPKDIRAAFLVFIVDRKIGNIITNNNEKRVYPLIWSWDLGDDDFKSLRLIEESLVPNLDKYRTAFAENRINNNRHCFYTKISPQSLELLKRAIAGFNATHAIACGVYHRTDDYVIGSTIAYVNISQKLTDLETNLVLWGYQDRLRIATDLIAPKFNDMTVDYHFKFNRRN